MTPPKNWGHVIFFMQNFVRNSLVSFFYYWGKSMSIQQKRRTAPPPPPPPNNSFCGRLTDRLNQPPILKKADQIKKTVLLAWKQPHRCFSPPRCAPSLKMTMNAIIPIVSNAAALSSSIFFKGRQCRRGSRF